MQCSNHLKQLALSTHNHHDTHGILPNSLVQVSMGITEFNTATTGGVDRRTYISALVPLLPFNEQSAVFDLIKEKLNTTAPYSPSGQAPASLGLIDNPYNWQIATFSCPSDANGKKTGDSDRGAKCNYAINLGDFMGNQHHDHPRSPFRRGDQKTADFAAITDGTSNTMLFADRRISMNPGTAYSATSRGSVMTGLVHLTTMSGMGSTAPSTCLAKRSGNEVSPIMSNASAGSNCRWPGQAYGFGRTSVTAFIACLPPNSVSCNTHAGGTMPDEGASLLSASSYHPGGVNVALADGAVRYVSETIDAGDLTLSSADVRTKTGIPTASITQTYTGPAIWGVWGAIGSRAGGESNNL